jgi:hypothetical protein
MEAAAHRLIKDLNLRKTNTIARKATALWNHRGDGQQPLGVELSGQLAQAFAGAVAAWPSPSHTIRSDVAQAVALAVEVTDAASFSTAISAKLSAWLAAGAHQDDFDAMSDHW